jgi:hypothetical protein
MKKNLLNNFYLGNLIIVKKIINHIKVYGIIKENIIMKKLNCMIFIIQMKTKKIKNVIFVNFVIKVLIIILIGVNIKKFVNIKIKLLNLMFKI